jgi:Mn-dependent DtxR family transcriptional regulator
MRLSTRLSDTVKWIYKIKPTGKYKGMKLRKSHEDYLEAILIVHNQYGIVKSANVAAHMNVSRPSVTNVAKVLRNIGFHDFSCT